MQFDQLLTSTGKQVLDFSLILCYFARIYAHLNHQACVINLEQRVVYPWQRYDQHFLLRMLRVIVHPFTYHKQMDRLNLVQLGVNGYARAVLENVRYAYPLMKVHNVSLFPVDVRDFKNKDVEKLLTSLKF